MADIVQSFSWDKFSQDIVRLIKFASKSTSAPINADRWEELIFHALKNQNLKYKGKDPLWEVGSHAPGADIWTDNFAISAKAGAIKGDTLVISSYRLTKFNSLSEMVNYIDGPAKNFDFYLCCARVENSLNRTYRVYSMPAEVFKASDLTWNEMFNKNGDSNGWSGVSNDGATVYIRRKMSNQLWIEIPLKKSKLLAEVSIPSQELGNELSAILES